MSCSYRRDPTSGYLTWIGNVAANPFNNANLDRVIVMVNDKPTPQADWLPFWMPSLTAYAAKRVLVSRKVSCATSSELCWSRARREPPAPSSPRDTLTQIDTH